MANVISGGQLVAMQSAMAGRPIAGNPVLIDGAVDSFGDYLAALNGAEVHPMRVWSTQPSVRKVIDFIARNVASTPLKVYSRVSDTDRVRVTDHPLPRILGQPSRGVIPYSFWHSVIADWLIYDKFVVVKLATGDPSRPLDLLRVQAQRVSFADDGLGRVTAVWVDGKQVVDPADCLIVHGYAPLSADGTSPMRTLAAILQESTEAVAYRRSVWKNQARVPSVIERPAEAPQWSPEAKDRFLAGWRSYTKSGGREAATPILEDGMRLVTSTSFSPKDTQDIVGRQLSDAEVASAFHIAPELVGARQGTYSNVEAFRQMLYRDALGPLFVALEQTVNAMLTPDVDATGLLYAEMDVDGKLRGSFTEEAQVMSTATGGPWLTRNEARARKNLTALPGGDELITPLNVMVGGQASPADAGTQNLGPKAARRSVRLKARAGPDAEARAEKVLAGFFGRQRASVLAALGAKAAGDWWDGQRWDSELAKDLTALSVEVSSEIGPAAMGRLGRPPGDYDVPRTLAWLTAVAQARAARINASTRDEIAAALQDPAADAAGVFARAVAVRAPSAAVTIVTAVSGFATTEAARQLGGTTATKTWVVHSPNPRPSHAAMGGEKVGIDDVFSNSMAWPGDGSDPDEIAGCTCSVDVEVP